MEEIPIYNAYDICQHQGCQCRSCGNDQSGKCLAGTGECTEAMGQGRCPVTECAAWIPKADIITTEYTVADMIRELREAFREQYGIDVHIQIHAYDGAANNPHLNRETAEKLGMEMARVFNGPVETGHARGETAKWYNVNPLQEERVRMILFYGDEEAPHEQNN